MIKIQIPMNCQIKFKKLFVIEDLRQILWKVTRQESFFFWKTWQKKNRSSKPTEHDHYKLNRQAVGQRRLKCLDLFPIITLMMEGRWQGGERTVRRAEIYRDRLNTCLKKLFSLFPNLFIFPSRNIRIASALSVKYKVNGRLN